MGVWGQQPPEASDISKNQIKWKPDIYFLKRKFHFFFESLCSEIGKKLHRYMGGVEATAPRSQRHFKESDKMEA